MRRCEHRGAGYSRVRHDVDDDGGGAGAGVGAANE